MSRFLPLLMGMLLCLGATVGVNALTLGGSSGILISDNPGGVYTVPATAALTLSYTVRRVVLQGNALFVPFVAREPGFRDSRMLIVEGYLGYTVGVGRVATLPARLQFTLGGGGYLRSASFSGATVARRGTLGSAISVILDSQPRWSYELTLRYRALLDQRFVHSVEPAIQISYRLGAP